jgi:hypothetical protein
MSIFDLDQNKPCLWQLNLSAEGIAAAQFARCGYDVSIQYGADKPAHDLVVAKGGTLLKVVVKGSHDGLWNLAQSYVKRATELSGKKTDYHGAIALWLDHHSPRTVCCLVQFQDVPIDELPRMYLATPKEVAQMLRESADGRGDSILYERNDGTARLEGTAPQRLPASWQFSAARIQDLITGQGAALTLVRPPLQAEPSHRMWPSRLSSEKSAAIAKSA